MKCPYNCNCKVVTETWFEHHGDDTYEKEVVRKHQEYLECLKEDCGVFCDGKCNYMSKS